MEKIIQINILSHNSSRLNFTLRSLEEIKKIENKERIIIVICFTDKRDLPVWEKSVTDLVNLGISSSYICIDSGTDNYMDKIRYLSNTDVKYSCSMDDDILISSYLWDYIIDNIKILDDPNNLLISPLISNGIPSVDLFIEDFLEKSEKSEIYSIFLKTRIENLWGVNYESLNVEREKWDYSFYDDVDRLGHYYKGIHPIRVSIEAHSKLAEFICRNPEKMMERREYNIEIRKFPYFCNSFYFIKTDTWKKIISDGSLFKDSYDEVPLNLYMQKNNLNIAFIRNGFCLHMAYNTINEYKKGAQNEIEEYYKLNFIEKI